MTLRHEKTSRAEASFHINDGIFFPPSPIVYFSLSPIMSGRNDMCNTSLFFSCSCLGLHILATHDVIMPFTEMANLPPLTINNYGIIISFVLQRELSRRAVIYLGAQQEVAGRLQSSVTVARRYLKAPAGVQRVQIRDGPTSENLQQSNDRDPVKR